MNQYYIRYYPSFGSIQPIEVNIIIEYRVSRHGISQRTYKATGRNCHEAKRLAWEQVIKKDAVPKLKQLTITPQYCDGCKTLYPSDHEYENHLEYIPESRGIHGIIDGEYVCPNDMQYEIEF